MPICTMFTANPISLPESKILCSVLAGLTDLVELNLEGTPTLRHARTWRRADPIRVMFLMSGEGLRVGFVFSRSGIDIGDPDGSDMLRILPRLSKLTSLDLSRLYLCTYASLYS